MVFPQDGIQKFPVYMDFHLGGTEIREQYLSLIDERDFYLGCSIDPSGYVGFFNSLDKLPYERFIVTTNPSPDDHQVYINFPIGYLRFSQYETWVNAYLDYTSLGSVPMASGFNLVNQTLEQVQAHLLDDQGVPRLDVLELNEVNASGAFASHISTHIDAAHPGVLARTKQNAATLYNDTVQDMDLGFADPSGQRTLRAHFTKHPNPYWQQLAAAPDDSTTVAGLITARESAIRTDMAAADAAERAYAVSASGNLQAELNALSARHDSELAAEHGFAVSASSVLQGQIAQTRDYVQGYVSEQLTAVSQDLVEVSGQLTRQIADHAVQNALDLAAEHAYAASASGNLQDQIDNLAATATSADAALQSQLNTQQSWALSASGNLQGQINSASGDLQDQLAAESAARTSADAALQAQVTDNKIWAIAASGNLQSQLTVETTARTSADSSLQSQINSNSTWAVSASGNLQSQITAEASARSVADVTIQTQANTDRVWAVAASGNLQGQITGESSARVSVDAGLQTQVTNNQSWAQSASGNLQSQITTLQGVSHTQNTDTGTSSTTFQVGGSSGTKIKNGVNGLEVRNGTDTSYADLDVNNLRVRGTTTTIFSETVNIADALLTLNSNVSGVPSENGGIEIQRGTSANAQILWDESIDQWTAGISGSLVPIFTHSGALDHNDISDWSSAVSLQPTVSGLTLQQHTHANKTVLDGTEQSFTNALKTKLDGIEAGAQVNTVTGISGNTPLNYSASTMTIGWQFSDAFHGNRGGGTLHADVTSTADGFMTAAQNNQLATLVASGIVDTDFTVSGLMRRTGAGTYDTITDASASWTGATNTVNASGTYWFNQTNLVSTSGTNWSRAYDLATNARLDRTTDVLLTSPASGHVLVYDASIWKNKTLANAGISALGHTHAGTDVTTVVANATAAVTATKFAAARNISLVPFDGSANIDIPNFKIADTRSQGTAPSGYTGTYGAFEFKTRTTIGSPGASGSFAGVMTLVPWSDNTGGSAYQLAFTPDGMSLRYAPIGQSSWGAWTTVMTAEKWDDTAHGVRGGGTLHADVTSTADGFMTAPQNNQLATLVASGVMDADFAANGLMRRTNTGTYDTITDGSASWTNTANTVGASGTFWFNQTNLVSASGAAWSRAYDTMLKWDGSALVGGTQATAQASLGLGTMATQNANAIAVTGGTVTGLTSLRMNYYGGRQFAVGSGWLDMSSESSGFGLIATNAYMMYNGSTRYRYANTHGSIGAHGIYFDASNIKLVVSPSGSSTADADFTPTVYATFNKTTCNFAVTNLQQNGSQVWHAGNLRIGTEVQAYSANLTSLASLTPASNAVPVGNGTGWGSLSVSTAAGNSTIVQRDSSGYIWGNFLNLNHPNTNTDPITAVFIERGSDGYVRKQTLAQFRKGMLAGMTGNGVLYRDGSSTDLTTDTNMTWDSTNRRLSVGALLCTGSASYAPLTLTSGTLGTAAVGAVEYDGTHFYGVVGSPTITRVQLDGQRLVVRTIEGAITTGTLMYHVVTMPNNNGSVAGRVQGVRVCLGALPTGQSVKVDVRKNGAVSTNSIFMGDTPVEILTNASMTNGVYQATGTLDSTQTQLAQGDVLYVVVTQVGSTFAGTDLWVGLEIG